MNKMLKKILLASVVLACCIISGPVFAQQFGQGWVPNPAETERFVKTIPAVYGDQVQNLVAADNDADALLYRALVPCLEAEGKTNRIKQGAVEMRYSLRPRQRRFLCWTRYGFRPFRAERR